MALKKMGDAVSLYQAFFKALGQSTFKRECSLLDAFRCGVFQSQLHGRLDVHGTRQIAEAIAVRMPLLYRRAFSAVTSSNLDYFNGLENDQIVLAGLVQEMSEDYGRQFWGFQSGLFFYDGKKISAAENLSLRDWHRWVQTWAQAFFTAYTNQILPLSASGLALSNVPSWDGDVLNFDECDKFIDEGWALSADRMFSAVEELEYRGLLVHTVYSSLTSSLEVKH